MLILLFYPENVSSVLHRNVIKILRDYTASYNRRLYYSISIFINFFIKILQNTTEKQLKFNRILQNTVAL
jgi:hypothetical protein